MDFIVILLLEITDEEQRKMKTIISKEEYKRRVKIKDLLQESLKQKEIYTLLSISKRTYSRYIKYRLVIAYLSSAEFTKFKDVT